MSNLIKRFGAVLATACIALVAAVCLTPPVRAQALSGEYKAPPVNTVYQFVEGGRTKIMSVNGLEFYRTAGNRELYQYGHLIYDRSQRFRKSDIDSFWPLAVGKTLETQVEGTDARGNQWTATLQAKVIGIEEVKLPAGTFQAFKIERALRNPYYQESSTFYWSPEAAYSIKGEYSNSQGRSSTWSLEKIIRPQ